jgi:hypothetical protein
VTINGQAGSGFLVELRDAGDTLEVEDSTLDYPLGIVFKVSGHRGDENSGGWRGSLLRSRSSWRRVYVQTLVGREGSNQGWTDVERELC